MTLAQDWEDVKRGLAKLPDSTLARVVAGLAAAPGRAGIAAAGRPDVGLRGPMARPGPEMRLVMDGDRYTRAEVDAATGDFQAEMAAEKLKAKHGSEKLMLELKKRDWKRRKKLLLMLGKKMDEEEKQRKIAWGMKNKAAGQEQGKPPEVAKPPYNLAQTMKGDASSGMQQVQTAAEAGQPADGGGSLGELMRSRMAGVPPTRESVQTVTEWGPHRWGSGTVPMATRRTVRTQMPTGMTQAQAAQLAVQEYTARRIDRQVAAEMTSQRNRDLVTYTALTGSIDDAIALVDGGKVSEQALRRIGAEIRRQTGRKERNEDIALYVQLMGLQSSMMAKRRGLEGKLQAGLISDPSQIKLSEVMPGGLMPATSDAERMKAQKQVAVGMANLSEILGGYKPGVVDKAIQKSLARAGIASTPGKLTPEFIYSIAQPAAMLNQMIVGEGEDNFAIVDAGDVMGDMVVAALAPSEDLRKAALDRLKKQRVVGGMTNGSFDPVAETDLMRTTSKAYIGAANELLRVIEKWFPELHVSTLPEQVVERRMPSAAEQSVLPMVEQLTQQLLGDLVARGPR